tara:strand:- start:545 stop:940 length:396 start_codon:yes stop_codon:yes gene_type:complete
LKKTIHNSIPRVLALFIIVTTFATFTRGEVAIAADTQNDKLVMKISKDFTKKFCNSVAFGLSQESAMIFSIEENKKAFERKKGIDDINKEKVAEEIALSVIDTCGYTLGKRYEKADIEEFKNSYIAKSSNN